MYELSSRVGRVQQLFNRRFIDMVPNSGSDENEKSIKLTRESYLLYNICMTYIEYIRKDREGIQTRN